MFTQSPLNARIRRKAPAPTFLPCLSPFEFGALVVDIGVPDEINVKPTVEVLALAFPGAPHSQALAIKRLQNGVLRSLLPRISLCEIPLSFADLVTYLHAHRALRQRANQRFERLLGSVAGVIVVVEGVQSSGFVAGDKAAIGPNHDVVKVVSDRQ